jgi:hypothetical protein
MKNGMKVSEIPGQMAEAMQALRYGMLQKTDCLWGVYPYSEMNKHICLHHVFFHVK